MRSVELPKSLFSNHRVLFFVLTFSELTLPLLVIPSQLPRLSLKAQIYPSWPLWYLETMLQNQVWCL